MSKASNEIWHRYYNYRIRLEKQCDKLKKTMDKSDDDEGSDEEVDEEGEGVLRRNLQKALLDFLKEVPSLSNMESHILLDVPGVSWEDCDELRSYEVLTRLFSPYALPRVVELSHEFHHRMRMYSVEFWCIWRFNLLRFSSQRSPQGGMKSKTRGEGVYFGDAVTRKHWNYWKRGPDFSREDIPQKYDSNEEMEILCSNSLKELPTIRGAEAGEFWQAIEDIDVSNFTPATVARIRMWLLGSPTTDNDNTVSHFDFIQLLFAAFGCRNFSPNSLCQETFGHEWTPDREVCSMLEGKESGESNGCLGWLEYQARLVSGALRPIDHFYQPYDELEARSDWGERVLDAIEQDEASSKKRFGKFVIGHDSDSEDREMMHQMPWLVWNRAKENEEEPGLPMSAINHLMKAMTGFKREPKNDATSTT